MGEPGASGDRDSPGQTQKSAWDSVSSPASGAPRLYGEHVGIEESQTAGT